MDVPETVYIIYHVSRRAALKTCYSQLLDATNRINNLKDLFPDDKFELVMYRRCMVCDA